MSLRGKLTWAFVLVVLVALIPAGIVLNAGFYSETMGQGRMRRLMAEGQTMHEQVQTPRTYLVVARNLSLLSGVAALGAAGVVGWWSAERITRSLRKLREAASEIGLRDLSGRVPAEGKDEIADLGRSFNRMCDRLEAEERSRRQLLADVAHELRHPLAVMKGHLDLLQEGKAELDQEALLPLQDEVIRLTRLVGDLRDLSLAEVGGLSLRLAPVDVGSLVEGLLGNMEPVAQAKGIELRAEVMPGLPPVEADYDRIRQVVVNLVANALMYTPAQGQVQLSAAQQGDRIEIRISDTGPGIDPEDLPHVFDRFYRADKSRTRTTGGSGLGLAIVRSLVELHGGTVSVESKPGEGTCFTVSLPLTGPAGQGGSALQGA